jgi:hypothetical protein
MRLHIMSKFIDDGDAASILALTVLIHSLKPENSKNVVRYVSEPCD